MAVSFGIEFEFDHIDHRGVAGSDLASHRYAVTDRWDYHSDGTVGSELRSPVWTSIDQAIEDIKKEFTYWISKNNGVVPYPYNRRGRSIGQHIHIGKYERRLRLSEREKIAKAVANVYPFLASLHAQPLPSQRGLRGSYCYTVERYLDEIPIEDHYAEISSSEHGTVEFRVYDGNIPQVSLTVAYIMQQIASLSLEQGNVNIPSESEYAMARRNALTYGVKALEVPKYLAKIKELSGISELPEVTCVKEILYLASKYFMSVYDVLVWTRATHYLYFMNMYFEPSKYLENVIDHTNADHIDKLKEIHEKAMQIRTIDELIEISKETLTSLAKAKMQEMIQRAKYELRRSEVKLAVQNGAYLIERIMNIPHKTREEVAERISELLNEHGEGYTTTATPREIIEAEERFYVFAVVNKRAREPENKFEIVGCIAIRMRDGMVGHLVVDRRFRGLGIAKKLLGHVLTLRNKPFYAYVRKGNVPSLNLFQSFGFRVVRETDRNYELVLGEEKEVD